METNLPLYDDRHGIVQLPAVTRICYWLINALQQSGTRPGTVAIVVAAPGLLQKQDFEEVLTPANVRVYYELQSAEPTDAIVLLDASDDIGEIAYAASTRTAGLLWIIVVDGRDRVPLSWLNSYPIFDLMADDPRARADLADLLWRQAQRSTEAAGAARPAALPPEIRQVASGFALPEIRRIVDAVAAEQHAGRAIQNEGALWRLPALRDLHPGASMLPADGERIATNAGELLLRWATRNDLRCVPSGTGTWRLALPLAASQNSADLSVTFRWHRNGVLLMAETDLPALSAAIQARLTDWLNGENARFDQVALALLAGQTRTRLRASGQIFVPAATTRSALVLTVELMIERIETVVDDAYELTRASDAAGRHD